MSRVIWQGSPCLSAQLVPIIPAKAIIIAAQMFLSRKWWSWAKDREEQRRMSMFQDEGLANAMIKHMLSVSQYRVEQGLNSNPLIWDLAPQVWDDGANAHPREVFLLARWPKSWFQCSIHPWHCGCCWCKILLIDARKGGEGLFFSLAINHTWSRP